MKKKIITQNKTKTRINNKTKNLISIILPLTTLFIIAIALKAQPTGLAVYSSNPSYRLEGSINITLQDELPADSYIRVKIDDYVVKINLIEFIKKSGNPYKIKNDKITTNSTYSLDFSSLGIIQSFEKPTYKIVVEIVHDGTILYRNEKLIGI